MSNPTQLEKPQVLTEIFFLRFVACLSVVFIHAISTAISQYETGYSFLLQRIQMVFMFATPLFVCISEIILSHSYARREPKQFWKKRINYLLLPYVSISIVYTILSTIRSGTDSFPLIWENFIYIVTGGWTGYFVIIIFQFYFIHFLFKKIVDYFPKWLLLSFSFLIQFFYLYLLNFGDRLEYPWADQFYQYSYLPFIAWIFYFVVGYYCGAHLASFVSWLSRYKGWIFIATGLSLLLIQYLFSNQILTSVSSKRVDIIPYTVLVLFFLYYVATKIKTIPHWALMISQASYGIYLLHTLIQAYIVQPLLPPSLLPIGIYILIQWVLGVVISLWMVILLNKWKLGPYFVGLYRFLNKKK